MEFSSLYRSMHHIQRPSSAGCSPHGSVRSLASLFERATAEGERSEADGGGHVPRDSVPSRVSEFETIIQRSVSAPNRSSSLPALHSPSPDRPYVASAVSAESLLVADNAPSDLCTAAEAEHAGSREEVPVLNRETVKGARTESACTTEADVEQVFSSGSPEFLHQNKPNTPPHVLPHHHHHHLLHHLNHQHLLKPSKCKGSCPASYTRFTTILRHERQQETPPLSEKKTMPPGNLFLMGPAPFRLRKNLQSQTRRTLLATRVTRGPQQPCSLSPELRPVVPRRLSSLEVLEKLSNEEGVSTDRRGNEQGSLDANGNPLAAHRRGSYLHPFTVTLSPLWSFICLDTVSTFFSTKQLQHHPFPVCVACFKFLSCSLVPFHFTPSDTVPQKLIESGGSGSFWSHKYIHHVFTGDVQAVPLKTRTGVSQGCSRWTPAGEHS